MVWFRRSAAILLAFVFILLFIPMLVISHVNATLGNPGFYIEQLRQADVYNFAYDEVMPAALEQASTGPTSQGGVSLALVKPYIPGVVKQTLPPDWLQAQTEQVISQVFPYFLGDTAGFSLNIELKGRVQAGGQAIKDTLYKKEVIDGFYSELIKMLTTQLSSAAGQFPVPVGQNTVESLVRQVFPPEWLLKQIDGAVDEVIPYLTKDREHFTIKINLADRLDVMGVAITDFLAKSETYNYVLDGYMVQTVKQLIQGSPLPGGITLTDSELAGVLKQLLPYDAYRSQVPGLVTQTIAYLKGSREDIQASIPLTGKAAAAEAMSKLLDQKLEAKFNSLPVCTTAQLANLSSGALPQCRPSGVSYADLKKLLGIDVNAIFAPVILALPDKLQLNLIELFGKSGNPLAQARDWVQKGFTYNDANLQASLGADFQSLQTARQWIAGGAALTERDLRQAIRSAGKDGEAQLQSIDNVRTTIGTIRRWSLAIWLIPLLILALVGLLGGRKWSSSLTWSSAVLAITALIVLIFSGPVFSSTIQPGIAGALSRTPPDKLGALVAAKGSFMAQNAVNGFIGGLKLQSIIILIVALAGITLGSIWYMRQRQQAD